MVGPVIEVELRGPVAVIRMAHGKVNALDVELLAAIRATMVELSDAGAIVLTGVGTVFSAGVDLRRIVAGGPEYVAEFLPALSAALLAVFDHPGPVVAAVNGHAIAGGCVLAAACDLRLMAGGTIGLSELLVGVPFPVVAMEIMRHAVGPAARPLALTGQVVSAAEAYRLGLVDAVTDPADLLAQAVARAEALAQIAPAAYALTKRQLHRPARDRIQASRATEDPAVLRLWQSPDAHVAIAGYLDRLANRSR
jgi:enoyl-CoA hydratase